MVDNLRTFDELVAQIPDNSSQLISAQDVREMIYALPLDLIEVEEQDDFILTMTDGIFVDVPTQWPTPVNEVARSWIANANSQLVPDFVAVLNVAPGLVRGFSYTASAILEKAGEDQAFTGKYRVQIGAGVPAAGDVNLNADTLSARLSYTDGDGADRTLALQETEIGDTFNLRGVFYRVTGVTANAGDLFIAYDSTPTQLADGGADRSFVQMLRTTGSPYELILVSNGVQFGQTRDFEVSSQATAIVADEFQAYIPFDQEPLSFQIRPVGHSTDLNVKFSRHRVFGVLV